MKRVLLALGILLLLVVAGIGIFIATFDANRYRPILVSRLEEQLDRPVTLERISLAWQGGMALRLEGVRIDEDPATQEPLLEMAAASATVRLLPLLKKRIEISTILLDRPRIRIFRDAQGQVNLTGLIAAGAPAVAGATRPDVQGEAVELNVGTLRVKDGVVRWTDATTQPTTSATAESVDLTVRHVSLAGPMGFRLEAVASVEAPDVRASGNVVASGWVDVRALANAPAAEATAPAWSVASLQLREASVTVINRGVTPAGEATLKALTVTAKGIAPGRPAEIEASGALASEAPNAKLTARVTLPDRSHPGSAERFSVTVERLVLEHLWPPRADEPRLTGTATVLLAGSAPTLNPRALPQAVSGEARITVERPVLVNLNILREVFERVSLLPGLVQTLEARLPPEYREHLQARDTVLEPIDVTAQVANGLLQFDDLHVGSDILALSGAGRLDVQGAVDIRGALRIAPPLSAAIIKSVKELSALTEREGWMMVPVVITGQATRMTVLPDLQYVASRVAAQLIADKAGDLLGDILGRPEQPPPASASAPQTPPQAAPSSDGMEAADPLRGLLQGVLEQYLPQDPSTQQ